MFRVVIHRKVSKELKNLQRAHLNKFAEAVEALKINPVPWKEFDVRKIEGEESVYRIRIGDFRVIYFFDKGSRTIHILKLERRGRIY